MSWVICDPVQPGDWSSARTERAACLLPHLRQFVQVRQALANAGVLGEPLASLLDSTRLGVIRLGRRGRIIEANDRARDILRRGDGLFEQGGLVRARLPGDNARLEGLLARVLPRYGEAARGGSLMVRRPPGLPLRPLILPAWPARKFAYPGIDIPHVIPSRQRIVRSSRRIIRSHPPMPVSPAASAALVIYPKWEYIRRSARCSGESRSASTRENSTTP